MIDYNINKRKIELSNGGKYYFSELKITKQNVFEYFIKIAEFMLPHCKERAITMHRFPDGINKKGFYQHSASDYFPKWITTKSLVKKEGGEVKHIICNNAETLAYIANQGCIVPHLWLSKVNKPNFPDKMIFDLDPPKENYSLVKSGAISLNILLEKYFQITSFLISTGSSGIHVVIPLDAKTDFDEVRNLSNNIAEKLVEENPQKFTTEIRKSKRKGRLYIDTSRNAYSQTSVAPYSLRAIKNAPVAVPLDWSELKRNDFNPQRYTIKNIFRRLSQKKDPWENIYAHKTSAKEMIKIADKKFINKSKKN